MTKANIR